MPQSIEHKSLRRIRGKGMGWVFSPHDFAGLGSRSAIDLALHRLVRKGAIRRVMRGICDYPRFSTLLNQGLNPDTDQTARALARKFGWRIQPGGSAAQNLLGLSTQVPARIVYLSDGPDRSYRLGNSALVFEHTAFVTTRAERVHRSLSFERNHQGTGNLLLLSSLLHRLRHLHRFFAASADSSLSCCRAVGRLPSTRIRSFSASRM
jgi:hypothetical protein